MKRAFSKVRFTLIYLFCKLALYVCRKRCRGCAHYDIDSNQCVITDGPCMIRDDYCFDGLNQTKSKRRN